MQYKLEISNGWDESFVLESDSFEKLVAIQSFIVEQEANGWADYVEEEEEEEEDDDDVEWFYDEETDEWYTEE